MGTPMLQVMNAVLRDEPGSDVTVSLLYANQTEDDILCRKELEGALERYGGRFKLHYTVDRPPEGWKHSKGFITKEMIDEHLPKAAGDGSVQILMCGHPVRPLREEAQAGAGPRRVQGPPPR